MIIDFHTHFYPEKVVAKAMESARQAHLSPCTDGTRNGLLESMQQNGIDYAVGLPLVTEPDYTTGLLRWAAKYDQLPIRMLGSIHPRDLKIDKSLELACELGFPGLKVHPEYQQFSFDEPELDEVWGKIAECGLFCQTHAGADYSFPPPYHSDPVSLHQLHKRHPDLKLILAHGGSLDMWDKVMTEIAGLDLWVDLAFVAERLPPDAVRKLIRTHGVERCLFGSDSPWNDQGLALEHIHALHLGNYEEEMILGGNAAKLLAL